MSRRLVHVLLLALAGSTPTVLVQAAVGSASVVAVQPNRVADLVMLDAGFDAGLRQGMVCRILRAGAEIAEVLVVELRPNHSAALIVNVTPRQAIRVGDSARIKVLKS
jgi:hypothetical protein